MLFCPSLQRETWDFEKYVYVTLKLTCRSFTQRDKNVFEQFEKKSDSSSK